MFVIFWIKIGSELEINFISLFTMHAQIHAPVLKSPRESESDMHSLPSACSHRTLSHCTHSECTENKILLNYSLLGWYRADSNLWIVVGITRISQSLSHSKKKCLRIAKKKLCVNFKCKNKEKKKLWILRITRRGINCDN